MATKILLKKSLTGGAVPLIANLDAGEIAINLVDRKIYSKDGAGAIIRMDGAYIDSTAPANPTEGDIWYDTTNNLLKAHNGTGFVAAGYSTIAALDDTTITSVADGEFLVYNNATSKWINKTLAEADVQAASDLEADVEALFSVTNASGDGSLAYSAGVFTYTGPSAAETRAHITGGEGITVSSGAVALDFTDFDTSDITEVTNLFFTDARARAAISVSDAGGDGSASYNNTTGVITYTGPSASEIQAHITNGTGVTITSGVVAIGQSVGTSDNVEFNKVTTETIDGNGTSITLNPSADATNGGTVIVAGNLTVNGTTTSVNSNEVNIGDAIIVLNSDETGTPSQDGGIEIERGTAANKVLKWNETDDAWDLGGETMQNIELDGGSY